MAKKSNIILNGDPRLKRGRTKMEIFFLVAFVVVPAVLLFITLIMLFTGFSWNDFCLVPLIIVLPYGNLLWVNHCPYCKHFKTMQDMGNEKHVDRFKNQVKSSYDEYNTDTAMDMHGNVYFVNTRTRHTQYGTEYTDIYAYNMVCKCCGCVAKYKRMKKHTVW